MKDMKRNAAAAYHEAGHAVAAAALGIRFEYVWIGATGNGGYTGGLERQPERNPDGGFRAPVRDADDAVMTAAGAVAEARHSKKSLDFVLENSAVDDFEYLFFYFTHKQVAAAFKRARKILSERSNAVEAVADGLLEHRFFLEKDVIERFRFFQK